MDSAVNIAVIRDGGGTLPDFREMFGQLVDVAGAVQERVVGVQVKMGELSGHEG